jgi:CheY-like chemotaxis protein
LAPILAAEEARLCRSAADVSLERTLAADLPPVALTAEHLSQVLGALLDNAREALEGPGRITVAAAVRDLSEAECRDFFGDLRAGTHVEITIADTGAGLSSEVTRRLFAEPFFSTKPRHRGFGLTLAYGILASHRGGLSLQGGADGGALARLVLPVASIPTPAASLVSDKQPPQRGERVLVVDDDPLILQLITRTLERAGYRVVTTANPEGGLAAYTAAAADPFRLVLADVVMPSGSGVDLAQKLLSHDSGVRVLFMSGQVAADYARQDFATSHFDLLPKPFRPETLLRAVRRTLERTPVRQSQGWTG